MKFIKNLCVRDFLPLLPLYNVINKAIESFIFIMPKFVINEAYISQLTFNTVSDKVCFKAQ